MPIYTYPCIYPLSDKKRREVPPHRAKERKGGAAGSERRPRKLHTYGNTDESVDKPSAAGRYGRTAAKPSGGRRTPAVHRSLRPVAHRRLQRFGAGRHRQTRAVHRGGRQLYGAAVYGYCGSGGQAHVRQCAADDAQKRRRDGARRAVHLRGGVALRYGGGIHQQRRGRRNAGQRAARSGGGLRPDEAGLSQVRTAADP